MMRKISPMIAGVILVMWGTGLRVAIGEAAKSKVLNNFVTELLNVKKTSSLSEPHGTYTFSNPRDGWVFFQTTKTDQDAIWVSIDSASREKSAIIHQDGKTAEAMRWLTAGKHEIHLWTEGKSSAVLNVRTMPEIIFSKFSGLAFSPTGAAYSDPDDRIYLYYWDFLQENILKNCNVICGGDVLKLQKWIADGKEGKKVIQIGNLHSDPEKLYAQWVGGFKEPFDGIIIDEFGRDNQIKKEWMEIIRRIYANLKFKGTLYAYLSVPWYEKAENCRILLETIMSCDYKWVPEFYLSEPSTEAEANKDLDEQLRRRMLDFRKTFPGSEKSCIACLVIARQFDLCPDVDFKVFLDMQMNMMANDTAFEGVGGVTAWTSHYADPEIIQWLGYLYRHYCIEGKREMLSPKYGFRLMMNYLKSSRFEEGLTGWNLSPAEKGSIVLKEVNELPFKKHYLPRCNSYPLTKRSAKKPNILSQNIRNLEEGRLYSFCMHVCDVNDITTRQRYAISVNLKGVELIEKENLQEIQQGDCGQAKEDTACWNYVYRAFRATADKATIEISDWADAKTPGGPIGQEIIYDFIQIQPLFDTGK